MHAAADGAGLAFLQTLGQLVRGVGKILLLPLRLLPHGPACPLVDLRPVALGLALLGQRRALLLLQRGKRARGLSRLRIPVAQRLGFRQALAAPLFQLAQRRSVLLQLVALLPHRLLQLPHAAFGGFKQAPGFLLGTARGVQRGQLGQALLGGGQLGAQRFGLLLLLLGGGQLLCGIFPRGGGIPENVPRPPCLLFGQSELAGQAAVLGVRRGGKARAFGAEHGGFQRGHLPLAGGQRGERGPCCVLPREALLQLLRLRGAGIGLLVDLFARGVLLPQLRQRLRIRRQLIAQRLRAIRAVDAQLRLHRLLLLAHLGVKGAEAAVQALLIVVEAIRAEYVLEYLLLFRRIGGEEALELALRQHHHLHELRIAHADDRFRRALLLAGLVALQQIALPAVGQQLQRAAFQAGFLDGIGLAPPHGAQPSPEAETAAAHREGELDDRVPLGPGQLAAQRLYIAALLGARPAVERDGHRVQQRGFARARLAPDQEFVRKARKIHPLRQQIRPEGLHVQTDGQQWPHLPSLNPAPASCRHKCVRWSSPDR